jgi:hypothetical protein
MVCTVLLFNHILYGETIYGWYGWSVVCHQILYGENYSIVNSPNACCIYEEKTVFYCRFPLKFCGQERKKIHINEKTKNKPETADIPPSSTTTPCVANILIWILENTTK